jgi:nitrate reductase gamma subunit
MKKATLMFILVFSTVALYSFSVKSDELTSKYGVSYAERQASNYIEKGGYSFRYLGNGYWNVNQLTQTTNKRTASSSTKGNSTGLVVIILVVVGVIIIIGKCVSNITTAVAKNSGMDEASAKKVGASAGVLAGTAAAIGAAALLSKAGGVKNKNNITITHRRV